jgi:tetratricopeptide (TPR) repeat protein
VIARVALAVVALAVVAALGVQLVAERRYQGAVERLRPDASFTPAARLEALRDLDSVSGLQPGTRALLTAAGNRLSFEQAGSAERLVRRALDREPRNFGAWAALAIVLQRRGDRAAAERALDRAQELNPLYPRPRLEQP